MKLKSLNFGLTHEVSHKRPTNPDLTSLPALHGIACTYIAGLSRRTQTHTHTKTHRDTHKKKKKKAVQSAEIKKQSAYVMHTCSASLRKAPCG